LLLMFEDLLFKIFVLIFELKIFNHCFHFLKLKKYPKWAKNI
jgi:hypothetical protein